MLWKSGRTTSFGVKRQRNADDELGEKGGKEEEFFCYFSCKRLQFVFLESPLPVATLFCF